ncbi:3-deoxy-D-manno-octulosonate cytidylyltransferase, partial [Salinivibrio sp. MA427]
IIPCRYGSSRLEGKPLLEINGKPLFWHVHQRCLEAGFKSEDIIIATDNDGIFKKAEALSLSVTMTSSEHESGTDRINEVVKKFGWDDEDTIINVQGDEPLVPPALIRELANFADSRKEFSITTVVTPIESYKELSNPNVVKAIVGLNNRALYFTRSACPHNREYPLDYSHAYRHIGIYAYTVLALAEFCSYGEAPLEGYEKLEQLRALSNGMSLGVYQFDSDIAHGVDTQEDYLSIKSKMENT